MDGDRQLSPIEKTKLVSQRYLDFDEETQEQINDNSNNILILSTIIENQIEFFNPTEDDIKIKCKVKGRLKLFADCDEFVDIDKKIIWKPQKKPKITRRIVEPDTMSEIDKIKSVAIDSSFIFHNMDTKFWTNRKKSKIMQYKSKTGNPYQFIEPENEFSKTRKKNCWSEKRISRTFKK